MVARQPTVDGWRRPSTAGAAPTHQHRPATPITYLGSGKKWEAQSGAPAAKQASRRASASAARKFTCAILQDAWHKPPLC